MINYNDKKFVKFITLGPAGTNHEFVTKKYIKRQNIKNSSILLIDNFFIGLELINAHEADYMIQVAVHPDLTKIVSKAHFEYDIHALDTFISASKPLALVSRKELKNVSSIGFQKATEHYLNLNKWEKQVPLGTIVEVEKGFFNECYDSAIIFLETANKYLNYLNIDKKLGTVNDPWVVFGKNN